METGVPKKSAPVLERMPDCEAANSCIAIAKKAGSAFEETVIRSVATVGPNRT